MKNKETPITAIFSENEILAIEEILMDKDDSYINQFWYNFNETYESMMYKNLTRDTAFSSSFGEAKGNCEATDTLINNLSEDDITDLKLSERRSKYYR